MAGTGVEAAPAHAPGGRHPTWETRGMFPARDPLGWRAVVEFTTPGAMRAFALRDAALRSGPTPGSTHFCSVMTSWEQLTKLALPVLAALPRAVAPGEPLTAIPPQSEGGGGAAAAAAAARVYASSYAATAARLGGALHARVSAADDGVAHTLRYAWYGLRCGILVAFRGGALAAFVPFANPGAVNTWGPLTFAPPRPSAAAVAAAGTGGPAVPPPVALTGDPAVYMRARARVHRTPYTLPDPRQWWANGALLCNVATPGVWGDAHLLALRAQLQHTAAAARVGDATFFLNKRDVAQLRDAGGGVPGRVCPILRGGVGDAPLPRPPPPGLCAPVASFYTGPSTGDVQWVAPEDWRLATGALYPPHDAAPAERPERPPWADRVPTAVFRGSATGAGVTPATNQRLALAALSVRWAREAGAPAGTTTGAPPLLDAGITAWNARDKVQPDTGYVAVIEPARLAAAHGLALVPRLSYADQARYKYVVYVAGHAAAGRLGTLLALGALVLLVQPRPDVVCGDTWLHPHLRVVGAGALPTTLAGVRNTNAVRVAADLSDLRDVLEWARAHDAVAGAIAANAAATADELLTREVLCAHCAGVVNAVAALQVRGGAAVEAAVAERADGDAVLPNSSVGHGGTAGAAGPTCVPPGWLAPLAPNALALPGAPPPDMGP